MARARHGAVTEAVRRAVLCLFVRRGLFEGEDAEAMLAWPDSGFHVHDAVLVPDRDMAFALRLARYCARNPVALERLEYDASARAVRYRSDMRDGPIAVPRLKFLPLPSTMAAGRTCNYGSTTRPILAARSGASS